MTTRTDPPKKVRLACRRCRVRRIKCDDQVPACTNCAKVGAVCLDVDSQNSEILIPRNFVNAAKARIQWLEEIIKDRLPDVDLDSGPRLETQQESQISAQTSVMLDESGAVAQVPGPSNIGPAQRVARKRSFPEVTAAEHEETFTEKAHSVAVNLGMLSLNSDSSQKHYLGSSSGLLFTHLIGASPSSTDSPTGPNDEPQARANWYSSGIAHGLHAQHSQSLHVLLRQQLPPRVDAEILLQTYIRWVHPDYCILDPASLYAALDLIYASTSYALEDDSLPNCWPTPLECLYWNGRPVLLTADNPDAISMPVIAFILFMVFSISAIVKTRSRIYEFPPDKFYQAALAFSKDCFVRITPETIQALVTIIVHGIFTPAPVNIWTLTHIGMAHCIELGLHREHPVAGVEGAIHQQIMRSIFWTLYSLDRSISAIQGRPLGFRDETFDVKMPEVLHTSHVPPSPVPSTFTHATTRYSICQFELDQIISDIKLHLYHLPVEHIKFSWPKNSHSDQGRIGQKLLDWWAHATATEFELDQRQREIWHLKLRIKYNTTMLLLFQPSQVIRRPREKALQICFDCACHILQDYQSLHDSHALYHGWKTVQNVFAAGATMIYSFWTSIDVRQSTSPAELSRSLRTCSTLLSIGGEWWPSVKQGYNSFGSIADLTVQKMYTEGLPPKQIRLSTPSRRADMSHQIAMATSDPISGECHSSPDMGNIGERGTSTDLNLQPQDQTRWEGLLDASLDPVSDLAPEVMDFLNEFDRSDLVWNIPVNETGTTGVVDPFLYSIEENTTQ